VIEATISIPANDTCTLSGLGGMNVFSPPCAWPPRATVLAMRVWIDLTNSPHVLVMAPVIRCLREDGHSVDVTARDFAQTLDLLERFSIPHTAIGRHRGERLTAKAEGLLERSLALVRWARASHRAASHRFDLALGHGSNDISVAARMLGIPSATMFDYEFAAVQHHINCRLAKIVVVPDAIPPERLDRYGARGKVRTYAGLKEEYYMSAFEPTTDVLVELSLDQQRPIAVVRTPPQVSLYHRFQNDLFPAVLDRVRLAASEHGLQPVLLPRTTEQREQLKRVSEFIVPERAIDAQSLIYHADVVISAGGTMNREAVALGTPVFTTFEGRLGALDEQLIKERRLRRLESPDDLGEVLAHKRERSSSAARMRRDPRLMMNLLLAAAES
jgi:hypothetical protein